MKYSIIYEIEFYRKWDANKQMHKVVKILSN